MEETYILHKDGYEYLRGNYCEDQTKHSYTILQLLSLFNKGAILQPRMREV